MFVYGSLLAPEVLQALLGRVPASVAATLAGHRRAALGGDRTYPGLVASSAAGHSVAGRLLLGLSAAERGVLDRFEGDEYVKCSVQVQPEGGGASPVEAEVYVFSGPGELLGGEWRYESWRSAHLAPFAADAAAWAAADASAPLHVSGLWLGEAAPHPSLAGAAVPTNPIRWALSLSRRAHGSAGPTAFGAGFFDDAGDVPGSPVLLFVLSGSWEAPAAAAAGAADGTAPGDYGTVRLTKSYHHAALMGQAVEYEGRLGKGPDGEWLLTGAWTNAGEGTHGAFACCREP